MSHTPNTLTMTDLTQRMTELGEQTGKGKDTQIKALLSCLEGGYHAVLDLRPDKHGQGKDDAVLLAETYVKAQGSATVFDAKAPNQQKLVSTLRTSIKFGQWPKGGHGEPMSTVNSLLNERNKLRRDPVQAKQLVDAANAFLSYARAQMKLDRLMSVDEARDFLFKTKREEPTAEDVLEGIRNSLSSLAQGRRGGLQDNSTHVRDALSSLNQRMADIARAKGADAAR